MKNKLENSHTIPELFQIWECIHSPTARYTTHTRQQDFEKAFYESEFRCRNLGLANARLMMDSLADDAVEEINESFLNCSVLEDQEFTGDLEFLCLEVQMMAHKKTSNKLIERLVCTRKTRKGGEKCNVRHDNCTCTIRRKKSYEKLFRRDTLACIKSEKNGKGCNVWQTERFLEIKKNRRKWSS